METFTCPYCGQVVRFVTTACVRCATELGSDAERLTMGAVDDPARRCAIRALAGCNWLIDDLPTHTDGKHVPLRLSCALTRTCPADGDQHGLTCSRRRRSTSVACWSSCSHGAAVAAP